MMAGSTEQRKAPREAGLRFKGGSAQRGLSLAMGGSETETTTSAEPPVYPSRSSRQSCYPEPPQFSVDARQFAGDKHVDSPPDAVTDRPRALLFAAGVNSHYI